MESRSYLRNIRKAFDALPDAALQEGLSWYANALVYARSLLPDDSKRAVGVIAALSPRITWEENKAGAYKLIQAVEQGSMIIPTVNGVWRNRERAWSIANHEYFGTPLELFGQDGRHLKIQRFFRNIMGESDCVTVDVWAARVAAPRLETDRIRGKLYLVMEEAYQRAAHAIGEITPSALQAACWIGARGTGS